MFGACCVVGFRDVFFFKCGVSVVLFWCGVFVFCLVLERGWMGEGTVCEGRVSEWV